MKKLLKGLIKKSGISKEEWERQYKTDSWSFLNSINELAHYSVIVGYLQYFNKFGNILDVGCGEGVLQDKLHQIGYKKYVGVDISNEAIKKAKSKKHENTRFINSTVDDFTTKEKFDAIIFNEILNYLEDPLETLKRYEQYLKAKGILVISMYYGTKSRNVWKKLAARYSFDETKVINKKGNVWICKCYQKLTEI